MPELPEVETVRRGLAPVMTGATIKTVTLRRANLRFPFPEGFAKRLEGQSVHALRRRAKYLLVDVGAEVLIMHLGMSGSFRIRHADWILDPARLYHETNRLAQHDHAVFDLSNGWQVTYNDPRRFGFMLLAGANSIAEHPMIRKLGLEPLDGALDGAMLASLFAGRKTSLKAALLDQSAIAGLGNIYVCEALHRAHLSPLRIAATLSSKTSKATPGAERLAAAIGTVLAEAVEAGGSSLRDFSNAEGGSGYFQHNFRVYDREDDACPTPSCNGIIQRIVQNGRSTFYCPRCQK